MLYYYEIQIHHLTPESVLHLSVFVHLCEAFLGIEPYFDLFRTLYWLVPHPSKNEIGHFGCARLELRPDMASKYIQWPRIRVDPEWTPSGSTIGSILPI